MHAGLAREGGTAAPEERTPVRLGPGPRSATTFGKFV